MTQDIKKYNIWGLNVEVHENVAYIQSNGNKELADKLAKYLYLELIVPNNIDILILG